MGDRAVRQGKLLRLRIRRALRSGGDEKPRRGAKADQSVGESRTGEPATGFSDDLPRAARRSEEGSEKPNGPGKRFRMESEEVGRER